MVASWVQIIRRWHTWQFLCQHQSMHVGGCIIILTQDLGTGLGNNYARKMCVQCHSVQAYPPPPPPPPPPPHTHTQPPKTAGRIDITGTYQLHAQAIVGIERENFTTKYDPGSRAFAYARCPKTSEKYAQKLPHLFFLCHFFCAN